LAKRTNPTLVGAFVLAAFALVIAALLFLGGGDWFTEKRRFVIYFENAIKGLTIGAPVTFKGVPIGRVTGLQVHYIKETGQTEIPVLIDIDPTKMITADQDDGAPARLLAQMISQGLRAQINPESLITNQQVVQLDFFPGSTARMVPSKLPFPQIPSIPSTFDQLQASLGNTAQSLPELAAAATLAMNQLSATLSPANQQKLSHILDNVDQVTGNLAAHSSELGKILGSLQEASAQLAHLLQTLDATMADNRQPIGDAIANLTTTTQSVRRLSDDLALLVEDNRGGLNDFANGSLYDLAGLIADSRTLVRRATDFMDHLDRDPSRLLLGTTQPGIPAK
jgi:paraquat-inducible protein B